MIKALVLFWKRNFKVLPEQEAFELGLTHHRNVYGDEINALNCRSIWKDAEADITEYMSCMTLLSTETQRI